MSGSQYISASRNGTIALWRPGDDRPHAKLKCNGDVFGVTVSADGMLIAVATDAGIELWRVKDQRTCWFLRDRRSKRHQTPRSARLRLRWLSRVLTDGPLCGIRGRNVRSENSNRSIPRGTKIDAVDVSTKRGIAVFGLQNNLVDVYSIADGKFTLRLGEEVPNMGGGGIKAVRLSPDGNHLIAARELGWVQFWDTRVWQEDDKIDTHENVNAIDISPDNTRVALAGNRRLDVWDMERRNSIAFVQGIGTIDAVVSEVTFSPRGDSLVTGASDGTVCLWRLSDK